MKKEMIFIFLISLVFIAPFISALSPIVFRDCHNKIFKSD